jgi:hypothetical protein
VQVVDSRETRVPHFMARHRLAASFLALATYLVASGLIPNALDPLRRPGEGVERLATIRNAALTDRDLLMAFTTGYAPNEYASVTPTSRMGWGQIALTDLAWYRLDDRTGLASLRMTDFYPTKTPSFADNMDEFERATAGRPLLPILDMPLLFMPEAGTENRRFLVNAAARHGTCLVLHSDRQVILVHAPDQPGGAPQFAPMRAPRRLYKRWWSDAVYVATYPAKLLVVIVFGLLAFLLQWNMH